MEEWHGDNPFYLNIAHAQEDGKQVVSVIDLDEPGWTTKHAGLMRIPARWFLIQKLNRRPILAMIVEDGDQPYYRARHVGIGSGVGDGMKQSETIAFGIGKKRPDGHVERLWYFRDVGMTVTGDDVNSIGIDVVKALNI